MYRIFIDEFGTHHLQSAGESTERYLGISGVIMPLDYETGCSRSSRTRLPKMIRGSACPVRCRVLVSVLVSVGFSFPFAEVPGAAQGVLHVSRTNASGLCFAAL